MRAETGTASVLIDVTGLQEKTTWRAVVAACHHRRYRGGHRAPSVLSRLASLWRRYRTGARHGV
jgi:hypothetical protein